MFDGGWRSVRQREGKSQDKGGRVQSAVGHIWIQETGNNKLSKIT